MPIINKGITFGAVRFLQRLVELFKIRRRTSRIEIGSGVAKGQKWGRGTAGGGGVQVRKGMQAKAVRQRRRLRDIAHASRKFNQRKAAA